MAPTGVGTSCRKAVEHMADGLYVLEREWRFKYLNRSVEAFVKRQRESLLGRVIWEAFPELLGTDVERAFRRAAEGALEGLDKMLRTGWFIIRRARATITEFVEVPDGGAEVG